MADTAWEKQHPRREQVNDRLINQHQRIHKELKGGGYPQGAGRRAPSG
jgi:hypothetical protein